MKVLVVGDQTLSFVAQDIKLLSQVWGVEVFNYRGLRDGLALFAAIQRSDLVLSWFCDVHAYAATVLARIAKRPSVIMDLPSHGFMSLCQRPSLMRLNRWTLRHADKLIAPSPCVANEMEAIAGPSQELGGWRCSPEVIPLAVDTNHYRPGDGEKLPKTVLTVARVRDRAHYRRKNIAVILATARAMDSVQFTLIGASPVMMDMAREDGPWPDNLGLVPEVAATNPILLEYYQSRRVYFQPSQLEGFGVACAEAMACACVPVVSPALEYVVGERGYIIKHGDDAPWAIELALSDPDMGKLARERIKSLFHSADRSKKLAKALDEVLNR